MDAPEPGEAVQRLQTLAGLIPSGDRTLDQVRRQLAAFGGDAFEVQPIPPKGVIELARERIRRWTREQVERSLGWLKRMNARGYDIYIRPAAPSEETAHPLAFVDDIDRTTVDRMRTDGFPFAVLNESSAGRFHGWVRIADGPLPRQDVTAAAKILASRYGADVASADWRHYGRLAGTTNRKPSRATAKGPPFVMLRAASTEVAPQGDALLAAVQPLLDATRRHEATPGGTTAPEARGRTPRSAQEASTEAHDAPARRHRADAITAFQDARAAARPARADDESARDFSGAMSLLRRGYSETEVIAAIWAGSPDLERRHTQPDTYVRRTVEQAAARVSSTPAIPRGPGR